ncbi:PAS domain-containing sensor histidine kinase [Aquincola sp. S2]|uniref:histidine kinase n=1 Tax=Pseudaquabacterium terrae TaxID=2732868 RepID=A0ABX2EI49_9BURK|nr:nitrogen regulation protein NR(II) [Aquabacterium terrae]NRF68312.1 PAS domain-containing sensor histidine kinase [Aquabacterium terrae]
MSPGAESGSGDAARYEALDLLATMVAIVGDNGRPLYVNAMLETVSGLSRKALLRTSLFDWFVESPQLRETLTAVLRNEIATGRFDGTLRRAHLAANDLLPVHVIVTQIEQRSDRVLIEMLEIEQQTRQDREERAIGQVQANKELIRNLAHEIKNPLGGIRGAAQLLQMELNSRELTEYTSVIINEADRLQALVDRLLAPHRRPHVVVDVNIHEVCERVRALILAEFPQGLALKRDYDTSIPDFRGDREQLIQAVLNIAQNAALALGERIGAGDARIVLRTRVARQVTIGKQRFRLALELHIEDNGPGVPEDIRDRIFYPLVSGREGGSGLGLTLAQTYVQQHLGLIECDSEPGRTVFKIVIPLP